MKLVGLDLETPQDIPEYGLQPWRARTGEATIKTCALWSHDGVFNVTKKLPSKKYFAKALAICAAEGYTITTWRGIFDIAWLLAIGLEEEVKACKWLDGMLLAKRVDGWREKKYGGVGYGLKETVIFEWPDEEEYALGEKVSRVPQTDFEWMEMLAYNLKDSKYTCLLTKLFFERLSPEERRGALIEAKGLVPIALSSINGVPINVEAMDALQAEVTESRTNNLEIFGADPSVIASPKKLGNLLFDEWGYQPIKMTPSGNPATDKETLLKMAILYPEDERFGALMALRKCNTRQSKFIDGVRKAMEYNGGPIAYPKPTIAGTYTGRLTYSSKQKTSIRKGKQVVEDESDE